MSFIQYFIHFLLLHLVITSPQINLDLTEFSSETIGDIDPQHDCLHVTISNEKMNSHDFISYCMSKWPSTWNIQNNFDSAFTFAELARKNITSEHLYRWSGSMDIIQRYQFYLNSMSISPDLSAILGTNLFFNCTSPRFGPQCQYSFGAQTSHHTTLNEVIDEYYLQPNEPKTATCYIHLRCNRGAISTCLDWSEICDGKVDCSDGIDEENCAQLTMHQCKDDEYRCDNGQCIAKTFFNDDSNSFECLDRSDEPRKALIHSQYVNNKPTFANEDVICSWREENPLSSSCVSHRNPPVTQSTFFDIRQTVSESCFLAFQCYFSILTPDDPKCSTLCDGETCLTIIRDTCPDFFYAPQVPVLFNHIYFAYTTQYITQQNQSLSAPEYICYNEKFCHGFSSNKITLPMNGLTCRRPEDFPVYFDNSEKLWLSRYVKPLYSQLMKCNTIEYNNPTVCNQNNMYQCKNSSKCIPISYVDDNHRDCDYDDDEEQITIDKLCLTNELGIFYKCRTTNKCIHRSKINNSVCDCQVNEHGLCDDEDLDFNQMNQKISFPIICDGFIDLQPIRVDGQDETDETECQYWPCNNTYTRCNDFWSCPNGADEINCDPSPLIKCPPNNHVCVSPKTNQLMCLPIEKAHDGIIDCLGGFDEPSLCTSLTNPTKEKKFTCYNSTDGKCLSSMHLCDGIINCKYGDDEEFCAITHVKNFVLKSFRPPLKTSLKTSTEHFMLAESKTSITHKINQNQNTLIVPSSNIRQYDHQCGRGIPLQVHLNSNTTSITCLCPPSFYGDTCQFQNQRVSLTVQLDASMDSQQTPFVVVFSLIDDSLEQIIHSYQQLNYLPMKDNQTKFNFYLLFSIRPKDTRKQYTVKIDIYNKIDLFYRGSLIIPLEQSFLPVQRMAIKVDIPSPHKIAETCSNQQCMHGRCIRYLNHPNINFCQCEAGWSGRYCNVSYMCTCSADSLCVGIAANKRSICICPIHKFGSQCFLHNTVCETSLNNICFNGGHCLPFGEPNSYYKPFVCICPTGFSGERCERPDAKLSLQFHKDIALPIPSSIVFHTIRLINNIVPVDGNKQEIICMNQTSVTVSLPSSSHISFVQLPSAQFYLVSNQSAPNQPAMIVRTVNPLDRCRALNEILNASIVRLHLIRRIKYYHLPCQTYSMNLPCFYDDIHICLCVNNDKQRLANCIEFDFHKSIHHLYFNNNTKENECVSKSSFNSTNLSTSSALSTPGITNGMPSIYPRNLFLYLLILSFSLYIQ